MKKFLLLAILSVGVGSTAFSLSESWLGLGFGWGNFFERSSSDGNTAKTYMSSPGVTVDAYSFWNKKNIGFFTNMAYLFPTRGTLDINGVKEEADFSIYNMIVLFDATIGPGFRFQLTDQFTLKLGAGFHFMMLTASYPGYGIFGYNLGIGGELGLKCDLTDVFYISTGSAFALDFASHSMVTTAWGSVSGWAQGYSAVHIRPYVCIGLNTWSDGTGFRDRRSGLGKPR
jgi:hypothetical protein